MLTAYGSSGTFATWIAFILESARISIMINRSLYDCLHCSQGVRQGDPLSPILCFAGRNLTFPSHLLFVDDIILFGHASIVSCRNIGAISTDYAEF